MRETSILEDFLLKISNKNDEKKVIFIATKEDNFSVANIKTKYGYLQGFESFELARESFEKFNKDKSYYISTIFISTDGFYEHIVGKDQKIDKNLIEKIEKERYNGIKILIGSETRYIPFAKEVIKEKIINKVTRSDLQTDSIIDKYLLGTVGTDIDDESSELKMQGIKYLINCDLSMPLQYEKEKFSDLVQKDEVNLDSTKLDTLSDLLNKLFIDKSISNAKKDEALESINKILKTDNEAKNKFEELIQILSN